MPKKRLAAANTSDEKHEKVKDLQKQDEEIRSWLHLLLTGILQKLNREIWCAGEYSRGPNENKNSTRNQKQIRQQQTHISEDEPGSC
jgi:hypothetical protein